MNLLNEIIIKHSNEALYQILGLYLETATIENILEMRATLDVSSTEDYILNSGKKYFIDTTSLLICAVREGEVKLNNQTMNYYEPHSRALYFSNILSSILSDKPYIIFILAVLLARTQIEVIGASEITVNPPL